MIASVPKGRPVTRNDLKKAKRILGAEKVSPRPALDL